MRILFENGEEKIQFLFSTISGYEVQRSGGLKGGKQGGGSSSCLLGTAELNRCIKAAVTRYPSVHFHITG